MENFGIWSTESNDWTQLYHNTKNLNPFLEPVAPNESDISRIFLFSQVICAITLLISGLKLIRGLSTISDTCSSDYVPSCVWKLAIKFSIIAGSAIPWSHLQYWVTGLRPTSTWRACYFKSCCRYHISRPSGILNAILMSSIQLYDIIWTLWYGPYVVHATKF